MFNFWAMSFLFVKMGKSHLMSLNKQKWILSTFEVFNLSIS